MPKPPTRIKATALSTAGGDPVQHNTDPSYLLCGGGIRGLSLSQALRRPAASVGQVDRFNWSMVAKGKGLAVEYKTNVVRRVLESSIVAVVFLVGVLASRSGLLNITQLFEPAACPRPLSA